MMPTIRTLGLAWMAALVAALAAAGLLAAALLWPPAASGSFGLDETRVERGLQAEVFGALAAAEGARMREDLRGLAAQLPPAGRSRLEQILAAEEQRLEASPPALVVASFAARLEATLRAIQAAGPTRMPPEGGQPLLLLAAAAGLAAALLAILAAPLALAPLRAAGLATDWAGRRDLWGELARARSEGVATPRGTEASLSGAEGPAELAQLRAEAQANLAMLRTEADATRRSLRDAASEGAKLGRAAEAAEGRLARAADSAERAVTQLGHLPHLAAAQSAGIEALAARVEQASGQAERAARLLAPVLEAASAMPETGAMEALSLRLESAAGRLAAEAEVAPEAFRDALADALGPLIEAAAALPHQAGAVAAEVAGLTATAERLEACGRSVPEALAEQASALASVLADQRAAVAGLEAASAAGSQLEALARHLPEAAGRIDGATSELAMRLGSIVETEATRLGAVVDRLDAGIAAASGSLDARVAMASERLEAGLATVTTRLDETIDAATVRLDAGIAAASGQLGTALAPLPGMLERAAGTAERQEQTAAHLAHLAELLSGAGGQREGVLARLFEAMPSFAARQEAASAELAALAARFRGDAEGHLARLERLPARWTVAAPPEAMGAHPALGEVASAAMSQGPSVAARLLRQLDPATATPAVTETLCRLDGVETEVARLLREAELIAGGPEPAASLPRDMVERTPELLESLDATIRRLQSVATAIAMASDGSRRPAASDRASPPPRATVAAA